MDLKAFPSLIEQLNLLNAQTDAGREPHARLLIGKLGAGLLPLAIAHAAYVLTGDSFNDSVWNLNYPDIHYSYPIIQQSGVGSSDDFTEQWRETFKVSSVFNLAHWTKQISGDANKAPIIGKDESDRIVHKLNLKSYLGGKKVLIIWGADNIHHATANKLLKLIEEPPDNTFIILLAESTDKILGTILSRCQKMNILAPKTTESAAFLSEKHGFDLELAQNATALADGDICLALENLCDLDDGNLFHALFVEWMRLCYKKDLPGLVDWADKMHAIKRDKQKRYLEYALNFFRQCMLERYLGDDHALLFGEEKKFAANFGKFVHGANVVELMETLNAEHYHIVRNGNAKVIFMDLSVQIVRLLHKKPNLVEV